MKKLIYVIGMITAMAFVIYACEKASFNEEQAAQQELKNGNCVTIPTGQIYASNGDLITPGYDEYGYNYQAQIFNGRYCDYDRVIGGNYCDVTLVMKWNDAWLSNKDCDENGELDRHYGFDSYIGSGAWCTNHQFGTYEDGYGNICEWDYFVKIIAAPADAYIADGYWYNQDGTQIGPVIWGQFAIIQQVENDPCAGIEGRQFLSPDHAGLGNW